MKRKSGDSKSFTMNMANDGIYNNNGNNNNSSNSNSSSSSNNNQSSNAEGVMESGRWVDMRCFDVHMQFFEKN